MNCSNDFSDRIEYSFEIIQFKVLLEQQKSKATQLKSNVMFLFGYP